MDYKIKYLKYKTKYSNLKNKLKYNLSGGYPINIYINNLKKYIKDKSTNPEIIDQIINHIIKLENIKNKISEKKDIYDGDGYPYSTINFNYIKLDESDKYIIDKIGKFIKGSIYGIQPD
jgi:hypothetical protein